jgi:hypothetical protein
MLLAEVLKAIVAVCSGCDCWVARVLAIMDVITQVVLNTYIEYIETLGSNTWCKNNVLCQRVERGCQDPVRG